MEAPHEDFENNDLVEEMDLVKELEKKKSDGDESSLELIPLQLRK